MLILAQAGFNKNNKPRLLLANNKIGEIEEFLPQNNQNITIKFNLSTRYCTGWHDLKTGENFTCPDKAILDNKYNQCSKCQNKTGFNPAFYHASSVSPQQQERNNQPHFVYLAYFSDEHIKVGISFHQRGIARLLEQGARAYLPLGEFATADIARSYEAKISKLPNIYENIKNNLKIKLLNSGFDKQKACNKLIQVRTFIEENLKVTFDKNSPEDLSNYYGNFINSKNIILVEDCQNPKNELIFSGKLIAQIGCNWLAEMQGELLLLPIKKYVGYQIEINDSLTDIKMPDVQGSLFDF